MLWAESFWERVSNKPSMTDFEGDFYRTGGLLEGGVFYKEDYFFEKVFCGKGMEKSSMETLDD